MYSLFKPLLRKAPVSLLQKRNLRIKKSYTAQDEFTKTVSCVLHTRNDRRPHETPDSYNKRSMFQLTKAIPKELRFKNPLLVIKVNQTSIDPIAWEKTREVIPFFVGHAISVLGYVGMDKVFHFLTGTAVSKVDTKDKPFESDQQVKEYQFFTPKTRAKKAERAGSEEFYIISDAKKIGIHIENYKKNFKEIENQSYDHRYNACGQAVHYVLTGVPEEPKISAQTGSINALQRLSKDNCTNHLADNTMRMFYESNAKAPGNEVGRRKLLLDQTNEKASEESRKKTMNKTV